MSIDLYRDLPALDEHLQSLAESSRGRMARVVAATGHMVTVEVPRAGGWDGPLGPYPASTTGLAAGTSGVLVPLRGNGWLFVAVGASLPQAALDARYAPAGCYLFAERYGNRPSSSTPFDTVSTTSQTLPAGTYIWSGSTKLTASGDSTGSGWFLILRNGVEVANGGAQLSFSGFTTLVTTFGGTFTMGSPGAVAFQGHWARASGAIVQHAAEIAIVVQRIG